SHMDLANLSGHFLSCARTLRHEKSTLLSTLHSPIRSASWYHQGPNGLSPTRTEFPQRNRAWLFSRKDRRKDRQSADQTNTPTCNHFMPFPAGAALRLLPPGASLESAPAIRAPSVTARRAGISPTSGPPGPPARRSFRCRRFGPSLRV